MTDAAPKRIWVSAPNEDNEVETWTDPDEGGGGMSRYDDYLASEYHRRNMQVARACGANAAVDQALDRARSVKGTPKWMIAYLESAADRLPGLQHDLAAWRELAPDRDEFVAPEAPAALSAHEAKEADNG